MNTLWFAPRTFVVGVADVSLVPVFFLAPARLLRTILCVTKSLLIVGPSVDVVQCEQGVWFWIWCANRRNSTSACCKRLLGVHLLFVLPQTLYRCHSLQSRVISNCYPILYVFDPYRSPWSFDPLLCNSCISSKVQCLWRIVLSKSSKTPVLPL